MARSYDVGMIRQSLLPGLASLLLPMVGTPALAQLQDLSRGLPPAGQQVQAVPPADPASPSQEAARNPDDGDDLTPAVARPVARRASAGGALGRTERNSLGLARGAIVIRTAERRLYYGIDASSMRVYPVAVGKAGARWHGEATVGRKVVDPIWHPTAHQRRVKHVPAVVAAGPRNPLGVRALYLARGGRETLYRIHGTNAPGSIGHAVSSGCIRMRNADVVDLYGRVAIGAPVSVR